MKKQFIAAIAGSAGSHKQLLAFFDHTPHDDVAYIVLQHLPATWRSELVTILSKHSSLGVKEIREGMVLQNDHIYVVPSEKYVTIRQGIFALIDRSGRSNQAADTFMISLAADSGDRSIGIVVEGALKDGTAGLKAIHRVGGLTMVQDPETCEFSSMPESAINAGVVDVVSNVCSMPALLHTYVEQHMHVG